MKQKGFTLIELLAVIVILAIIALIAVPVILNVIEKSKIGAAEQSAQGYVDAVEKQIVTNKVKNENLIEEGEYTKAQLDEKNVKIKGEITDALVVVGEKGKVTQARFCINGYSIDYDGKKATKNTEDNYCSEMNSIVETCPYEENQVFNFDYTGDIQEFTPECTGKYKLEVWGAEGGHESAGCGTNSNSYNNAGKGGYSYGETRFSNGQKVYVVVGQSGLFYCGTGDYTLDGAYNGGGAIHVASSNSNGSGGGGATHIALHTGLLSSLESYKSDILIVAGGGGGGSGWIKSFYNTYGGNGGGYIGGYGAADFNNSKNSEPGNQSSGGNTCYVYDSESVVCSLMHGSFGQGGRSDNNHGSNYGGAGGGGYYGGAGGGHRVTGGGGSGYIENPLLLNKGMYMYNGGNGSCTASNDENTKTTCTSNVSSIPTSNYAKQGNGYARITYLGK